jgi:hypothetical protein
VIFLLLVVLALAVPAQASAQVTNMQPASDGLLYAAIEVADEWWADQGQLPCKADVYVHDEAQAYVAARATYPEDGCYVTWSRSYVAQVRGTLAGPFDFRRWAYEQLCMAAIHERGHNLGLRHSPGIMAAVDMGGHPPVGRCRAWAARLAPKRARARSR